MSHNNSKATKIFSFLYLGGKSDAKNKDFLIKENIKYILNCTPQRSVDPSSGCPNFYEKEKLFTYKRIPIFDNRGEDIISHMDSACRFIEEGKHYGGVLVHCHKGISRSASFIIGYLMNKHEMTYEEAYGYVKGCRSIIQPNESFINQLTDYDITLNNARISANELCEDKKELSLQQGCVENTGELGLLQVVEHDDKDIQRQVDSMNANEIKVKPIIDNSVIEILNPSPTRRIEPVIDIVAKGGLTGTAVLLTMDDSIYVASSSEKEQFGDRTPTHLHMHLHEKEVVQLAKNPQDDYARKKIRTG